MAIRFLLWRTCFNPLSSFYLNIVEELFIHEVVSDIIYKNPVLWQRSIKLNFQRELKWRFETIIERRIEWRLEWKIEMKNWNVEEEAKEARAFFRKHFWSCNEMWGFIYSWNCQKQDRPVLSLSREASNGISHFLR